MTRSPGDMFVHTDSDLFTLWTTLMGHGGFGRRSLWMVFIESDGRLSPTVVPIDDVPNRPDDLVLGTLAQILRQLITPPVAGVAMLLSRPGPRQMQGGDRAWVRALRSTIDPELMPWPVHLATADHVQVFAPDDLVVT